MAIATSRAKKNITDRLRSVIGDQSLSEFSRKTGLNRGKLHTYASGRSEPSASALLDIAIATNTSLDWLAGRKGAPREFPLISSSEDNPDFVPIRLDDMETSAGSGVYPDEYPSAQALMFRKDWVRRHGGADRMFCLHARGDSMEPTIGDGDVVLFLREETILQPGIYVFNHAEVLRLKRLELAGKQVATVSDNPRYPPERLPAKDIRVIGRAIWSCGEM